MLHISPFSTLKIFGCFLLNHFVLTLLFFSSANAAEINALSSTEKNHIRTLAASCAACHGTHGNSAGTTPVLAGLDATYFSNQMIAFKHGGRDSTVMHHHAKGLHDDEIYQLATYFSQQKRVTHNSLKSQILSTDND